jgi:cellulose synthase operon protein C
MTFRSGSLVAVSFAALLLLSACDTAEERAQGHYERAVELIDDGDVDRGLVELRNVFQLNAQHVEARKLYARTMLSRGNLREAFGNYTLVSEQLPNDLESRIELARLAIDVGDWEAFDRHVERAMTLAPDQPEVQLLSLVSEYRAATLANDGPARTELAERIGGMKESLPGDTLISQILIENHLSEQRFSSALAEVDAALAAAPDRRDFQQTRLALLAQLGDESEVERQLLEMVASDPSDVETKGSLIRWYLSRGETEKAEEILRADAVSENATTEQRVQYIYFLNQSRGTEAARDAIDGLIEGAADIEILRSLRAGLDFDAGRREEAIAEMESIIAGAGEGSGEVIRDVKVSLARMLEATGNQVAARQRVEEVLAEDTGHVEALKLRAGWFIAQDRPDDAILNLRAALDQAPRDPQIMTLMASAYLRSGSRELAGEMLSLAVESSNNAPDESIRYARFLLEDDKAAVAEPVLVDALRIAPNNIPVLIELGRVYLAMRDWPRLEQVEGTLRRSEQAEAVAAADSLRVTRLQNQDRTDEALALLETMAGQQGSNAAQLEIVRTHLRNGDTEAAEAYLDGLLADDPQNDLFLFLKGALYASTERPAEAEEIYRNLIAERPEQELFWRTLYTFLNRQGRFDDARTTLEEALETIPGAPNLQWALAGERERAGDIDGAIEIYEALYAANSDSVIVANNLASLISTHKTDTQSLDRAWAIARRLRGLDRPEFQDTYGWIALRRGEVDEAVQHLEPAAAALNNNPLVQFHLGMAYVAADRPEDAIAQLRRAIDLAGPADTRPQFQQAREEIARLEALTSQEPSE